MRRRCRGAFSIVELLIVMAIIIVLGGLILATGGYVQSKAKHSRAEAEIAAISAALENYKADNGVYPSGSETNALKANVDVNPTDQKYKDASLALYKALSGDADNDPSRVTESKSYFPFKPNQLAPTTQTQAVTFIKDPFGFSYGYSTVKSSAPAGLDGYNPTFDIWSTAGGNDPAKWIKNW